MEQNVTLSGNAISYTLQGSGNTLVLLHGFMETKEIWKDFSIHLSKSLQVVTIDLPGHGKSSNTKEEVSMEEMAYTVKLLLEHLNISTCTIIGHSMGGYVSLAFANKYSQMLRGLGLFHSHPFADDDTAKTNRDRAIDAISNNHSAFIRQFIPDLFAPENKTKLTEEIAILQQAASQMQPANIIAAMRGMKSRNDQCQTLENLSIPILAIVGAKDPRTPFGKMTDIGSKINHYELLYLKNCGHMGYLEAYMPTLLTVEAFVKKSFAL